MWAAMLKEMKQKSAVRPAMRALEAMKVTTDDKSAFSWWQQDRAPPKAFLYFLTACHLPCVLLCLQEGAKEFAALHNPRSKCSGRRRRRHHVVSASCSNAPASAVAETREGDSDRDTGNEWASSSSGMASSSETHFSHLGL